MSNVIVKENETLDSALRRFKRSEFDRYDEKRDALPKKASVSVVQ